MTGSDASYLDDMLSYALDAIESLGDAGRDLTILADTVRIRSPSLIDERRRALGESAP